MGLDLGFSGGAAQRLAGVALFALVAVAGVLAVEHGTVAPPAAPIDTGAPAVNGALVLETTYPVERWTVQAQGREVVASASTAQRWEGIVGGDRATIFVQADAADAIGAAPVALRWRFAGRSGVLWGEGSVAGTLADTADGAGAR
jgi:hypothetical protein